MKWFLSMEIIIKNKSYLTNKNCYEKNKSKNKKFKKKAFYCEFSGTKLLLCVYSFSIKNCMIIAFSLNEIVQLQKHWIKCIKNWVFANKGIYIFHKIAHNKNCSRASHETHRRDKKTTRIEYKGWESARGKKLFFRDCKCHQNSITHRMKKKFIHRQVK